MDKGTRDLLYALALLGSYEFSSYYVNDPKINDCLMNMYFYMMHPNEDRKEEYFQQFEKIYRELDEEQQEIVKKDYIEIIEAQEKNREKEKIKKKGMINYE